MGNPELLEAYQFHESNWEDFKHLESKLSREIPNKFNIADYICVRWNDDEERTALYVEDDGARSEYTYSELDRYSDQFANFLVNQGYESGDCIGVSLPQSIEALISHVAILKMGGVTVPLSMQYGHEGLKYRIGDCGLRAIIASDMNVDSVRRALADRTDTDTIVCLSDVDLRDREFKFWDVLERHDAEFDNVATRTDDDAIIHYTSGTTGEPKGVLHGHDVLLGWLPGFLTTFANMRLDDREVFWTPINWIWVGTFTAIVLPVLYYGKTLLGTVDGRFHPEKPFDIIEKYDPSLTYLPPTGIRQMMQVDEPANRMPDNHNLRLIVTGGEPVGEDIYTWLSDVFGATVHTTYGQTEMPGIIGDCAALFDRRRGTMGRRTVGLEVGIVEPGTGQPIRETGEVGEIAVLHNDQPPTFKEYLNKPEVTAAKFADDWFLTGDLGKRDEDGHFAFVGRKDEVIISSGHRISPGEVQEAVEKHDQVVEATVIGVPDETRGKIVKAFVVPSNDAKPSGELKTELQNFVKENLAMYQYPREIEFMDEIPKTVTDKVDRSALTNT